MSRETLKNFLNKIGKTADSISYKVNPASGNPDDIDIPLIRGQSDLGIDPNTGLPLIDFDNNKGMLGDFLSDITQVNEFKIKEGTVKGEAYKRGLNITNDQEVENKFVNNSILEDNLNSYSNSKLFNNLDEIVDKNSKNFTNHNLLKDISGGDLNDSGETLVSNTNDNIVNTVSDILSEKNRYANNQNSTAFAPKGVTEENFHNSQKEGSRVLQNSHGNFNKNGITYSIDELKKVGLSMLYKASGYDKGTFPGESLNIEDIENNPDITPDYFANDKFAKINFENVRALNAKTAPQDETGRPHNEDNYFINTGEGENKKTFGQTYNDSVRFDGKNSNLLKAKAIVACKSVILIAKDFYRTLKNSISHLQDEVNPNYASNIQEKDTTGPFFLGSSRGVLNANLDLIKNSVISRTKYDFSDCVDAGYKLLFGNTANNEFDSIIFQQSPGHLLAICLSAIKGYESYLDQARFGSANILDLLKILKGNKLFKFINVIATIGDRALEASGGNRDINNKSNARDVDTFKDLPGNRVSKFRKRRGRTQKQIAWNSNETPNAYLLPTNIVRAAAKLNMGKNSPNPVRGIMGSELSANTYISSNNDGSGSRIPNEVVKELEDRLDAEYVPFYVHDLRTNEIISFHAFLDSVSDTISPNFNPTPGYGRMDPVQIYNSTSRNVGVSFTLVATSKEDFNLMWYKINKLTTLAYPQWTQGTKVSNGNDNIFIQPFSQVIGASPLVRLRIGDLIKSNYSRFNLARLFGIGDPNIKATPTQASGLGMVENYLGRGIQNSTQFLTKDAGSVFDFIQEGIIKTFVLAFGSPAQYTNIGGAKDYLNNLDPLKAGINLGGNFEIGSGLQETLVSRLKNGFVNPLVESAILENIQTPNIKIDNLNAIKGNATNIVKAIIGDETGYLSPILPTFHSAILLANTNTGYRTDDQRTILLSKLTKIKILEYYNDVKIMYKVQISDSNSKYDGQVLFCSHSDIYADPDYLFMTSGLGQIFGLANGLEGIGADAADAFVEDQLQKYGVTPKLSDVAKNLIKKDEVVFMEPENNPFVKAYESTKGRGLAGTLSAVQFTWGVGEKYKWETDWNSRAPMGCKVSFTLNVIHDIPPGIDHSGFNRAPIYNVGEIMHDIAGDPYEDGGAMSKFRYDTGREDKKIGE